MAKILVTSDLHFDDNPNNEYRFEIIPVLMSAITSHKPDAVVIAGDLTDKKDRHPARLVLRVVDQLIYLAEYTDVYILAGNHDRLSEDNDPFFEFLDEIDGIYFISTIQNVKIEDAKVLFTPHSRDPDDDWKDMSFKNYDYIFFHQTFHGAKSESGKNMEGTSFAQFRDVDAICVSGDIHVPQRLGPITYCGSPYPVRFGDTFDPRILLLDNGKKKSIPVDIIKKHSLAITDSEEIYDHDIREGDQIKVTLALPKSELVSWEEHKRRVQEICKELDVSLFGVSLDSQQTHDEDDKQETSQSKVLSPKEAFDMCCEKWETPDNVRKTGLELMDKAKG